MYYVFGKYFKNLNDALAYAKLAAKKSGDRVMIVKTSK